MTTIGPIKRGKDDLPSGSRIGRYRLEDPVGRGGMGTVYRAYDETTNRNVALKLLAPDIPPSLRERFLAECEAEANIRHEHVMPVYDRGWLTDERPYFVMELLYEPITLTELMDEIGSGRLGSTHPRLRAWNDTRRLIADVLVPICEGVHVANAEYGIQHRDLKPDNVLVDIRTRRPYLIDFGICRTMDDEQDRGKIVGTPRFLSPEQASARPDPRTDVWGLGAILYYVVAGEPPLLGTSPFTRAEVDKRIQALEAAETEARAAGEEAKARGYAGRRQQLQDPTLRVQEDLLRDARDGVYVPLPDSVPSGLAAVIHKAMARDSDQRYGDAGELLRDLKAWLGGGAVQALQEASSRGAAVDFARRLLNRHVVRGVGALVALLIGLGATTGILSRPPPHADHRAEDLQAAYAGVERTWALQRTGSAAGGGVLAWLAGARLALLDQRRAQLEREQGVAATGGTREVPEAVPVRLEGWHSQTYEVHDLLGLPVAPASRFDGGAGLLTPGTYQVHSAPQEAVNLLLAVPASAPPAPMALTLGPPGGSVPEGMTWIPAGKSDPAGDAIVKPFLASRGLVTNERWSEWLDELPDAERAARVPPEGFVRDAHDPRRWLVARDMGPRPVRGVRPTDAAAYAAWRSSIDGVELRLPSEREWCRMAAVDRMGSDDAGAIFPWRAPAAWRVRHRAGERDAATPGARVVRGASPYGVRDLFEGPGEMVRRSGGEGFALKGRGGLLPVATAVLRSEPLEADAAGHPYVFRLVAAP